MTEKSIRTPLARAKGLGSAKDGTMHWWMQRVTAVALLPLSVYMLLHVRDFLPPADELSDLTSLIAQPVMSLALVLSILTGFYHAALGVQVIVEDYVHGEFLKTVCLMLNKISFFFLGVAGIYAVLLIDLAGKSS